MAEKLSNWEVLQRELEKSRREADKRQAEAAPLISSEVHDQIIADMDEWERNQKAGK
jgi:hypothetical protein